MNKDIKDSIDNFLVEFENLPVVKNYVAIKNEMLLNKEFNELKEAKKKAQKDLAISVNQDNYEQCKQEFLKLEQEYNNHPLMVTYLALQEEIHYLLKEIETYLK